MSIPKNRDRIIAMAKENDGIVTKKQVVEELGRTYYYNGDKHLGAILSTMVNNGVLERVKNGVFKLLKSPISHRKQVVVDKNQSSLF